MVIQRGNYIGNISFLNIYVDLLNRPLLHLPAESTVATTLSHLEVRSGVRRQDGLRLTA